MKTDARAFAIEAHGNQRYGEHPYSIHLDEVACLASEYGDQAMVVAYLHDVVEDTQVTIKNIEDMFGAFVARCVAILSDEPGATRKIRKAVTYKKMATVQGEETLALLVKAADRLANLRACIRMNNQALLSMYRSEHAVFQKAVYRPHLCEKLWQEIEKIQNAH